MMTSLDSGVYIRIGCTFIELYMTSYDVNFVNISHFIMQLPGVDPNDPSVRDVLASLEAEEEVTLCRPLI